MEESRYGPLRRVVEVPRGSFDWQILQLGRNAVNFTAFTHHLFNTIDSSASN